MLTSTLKKEINNSFTKNINQWEDKDSNIVFKFDKNLEIATAPDDKAGREYGVKMVDIIVKNKYLIENKKTYQLAFYNKKKMTKINDKFENASSISSGLNVLIVSSKISNDFSRRMKLRRFIVQTPQEIAQKFKEIWESKGFGTIWIIQSKKIIITDRTIKAVSKFK